MTTIELLPYIQGYLLQGFEKVNLFLIFGTITNPLSWAEGFHLRKKTWGRIPPD